MKINNSVRFASIFPSSGIRGFISLQYWIYPYYRSIVSLRFDIVAIASIDQPFELRAGSRLLQSVMITWSDSRLVFNFKGHHPKKSINPFYATWWFLVLLWLVTVTTNWFLTSFRKKCTKRTKYANPLSTHQLPLSCSYMFTTLFITDIKMIKRCFSFLFLYTHSCVPCLLLRETIQKYISQLWDLNKTCLFTFSQNKQF